MDPRAVWTVAGSKTCLIFYLYVVFCVNIYFFFARLRVPICPFVCPFLVTIRRVPYMSLFFLHLALFTSCIRVIYVAICRVLARFL